MSRADLRLHQGGQASVAGRVPPHNLDAEIQCLAHALTNARYIAAARAAGLEANHFYDTSNGRIWQAICAVYDAPDSTVTPTTVHEWLRARGWIDVAGEARLRALAHETALAGPMRTCAKIVVTLARVRMTQAEAHLLANEPYGDIGDPDEWLEAAPHRLARHATNKTRGLQSFGDTIKASWQTFSAPLGVRGGYATGLESFDAATGGLFPAEVLLVSAKEKAGKSMLVGQWFGSMAGGTYPVIGDDGQPVRDARGNPIRRGRACLIFALDAAKKGDWAERVAASRTLVDLERFRRGTATQRDRDAMARAVDEVTPLPVYVDGKEVASIGQMGARIRALRDELAATGTDLVAVAIDYIQLARGEGQTREQQIATAMRAVVKLAGEEDLARLSWVVITQTNSEGELAQCKALAQMCDGWIHLTVDEDKPSESWWGDTAQGGEVVPVYPARLEINRSRRGAMGKRAAPIPLWCCYRFTFFYDRESER